LSAIDGLSRGAFLAEQSKQVPGSALTQPVENTGSRLIERAFVLKDVVVPVCFVPQSV
jgi:hypothetical protein